MVGGEGGVLGVHFSSDQPLPYPAVDSIMIARGAPGSMNDARVSVAMDSSTYHFKNVERLVLLATPNDENQAKTPGVLSLCMSSADSVPNTTNTSELAVPCMRQERVSPIPSGTLSGGTTATDVPSPAVSGGACAVGGVQAMRQPVW